MFVCFFPPVYQIKTHPFTFTHREEMSNFLPSGADSVRGCVLVFFLIGARGVDLLHAGVVEYIRAFF